MEILILFVILIWFRFNDFKFYQTPIPNFFVRMFHFIFPFSHKDASMLKYAEESSAVTQYDVICAQGLLTTAFLLSYTLASFSYCMLQSYTHIVSCENA